MTRPIYLDYHATTPVDPRVLDAMLPFFTEHFGNPASRQHAYGWDAQKAVDAARTQVADARRRVGRRDRLHQRRDRVQQPRDQGRGPRASRSRRSRHHRRHRAQVGAGLLQAARARGLPRHAARRGRGGLHRPGRAPRRDDAAHRPHLHHGGQQRDRRAAAAGGHRRHRAGARRRCSTPTPRRRPARSRSTSPRWASICSR